MTHTVAWGLPCAMRITSSAIRTMGWGPEGIGDRTDIGNWWEWFRGPNSPTYLEALYTEHAQHPQFTEPFARLDEGGVPAGENEVVVFKSCFPNSHVGGSSDEPPTEGDNPLRGQDAYSEYFTVANAKGIYRDLLDYFATRQDRLFVLITSPRCGKVRRMRPTRPTPAL
ncbi:MAG: hypothetical protein HC884_19645 [Chloroflexaceae bacterium]|nr:hypothetical protein [Chloroflexaceae bacterium]